MGWAVAPGLRECFRLRVGLENLIAGRLVATVTEAILPLASV